MFSQDVRDLFKICLQMSVSCVQKIERLRRATASTLERNTSTES
ncbi:hypothetical protein M0802_000174 [Mischocyttarus mexicanus]|nr:hypothetical protein M0802_000174 [Mischocyttarus mexicanus]